MADEGLGRTVLELATDSSKFFADLDKVDARVGGLKRNFADTTREIGRQDREFDKLRGRLNQTGTAASGLGSQLKSMLPVASIAGVGLLAKNLLDASGALVDMSNKTGLSIGALQRFKFAAEQSGTSLEAVVTGVEQLQKRLTEGDKNAIAAVQKLGFNLDEIRKMKPEQQFEVLTSAITKIEDPAQRTTLRMQLMGRSGNSLAADFKALGDEAESLGLVMADDVVKGADDLGDNFDKLIGVGKQLIGGVFTPLLPILNGIATVLVTVGGALNTYIFGPFFKALDPVANFNKAVEQVIFNLERLGLKAQTLPTVIGEATASLDAQRKAIEARADLGIETVLGNEDKIIAQLNDTLKENNEKWKAQEEAVKKVNDAADKYNQTQDATIEKMRSMGVFTQEVAAKALAPYIEKLNLAAAAGDQNLRVALIKLEPEIRELAAAMRAAGMDTQFVTDMLDELRGRAESLPPVIERVADDVSGAVFRGFRDPIQEAGLILQGLPPLATTNLGAVADAFETLGITSRAELQRTADEARRAYDTLKASGLATEDELKAAWKRVEETARAAAGNTTKTWAEAFPRITGVVENVRDAINGTFAQMLLGAKGFKDGFLDIWESIKAGIGQILTQILQDFTNRFLTGLIDAMLGRRGAFQNAFASLFPPLGGGGGGWGLPGIPGLPGWLGGGGATLPNAAGVGSPIWNAGAGLPAGGSAAAGGGFLTSGLVNPWVGAAAGAGAGWFMGNQTGNKWGSAGTGAGVGFAVGGPIGALIGAGVGWWAAKRENIRTNDLRDAEMAALAERYGLTGSEGTGVGSTFHNIAARLTEAGHGAGGGQLFQQLVTQNDREGFRKALEAVNKALAEYEQRTQAATAAEKDNATAIAATKQQHLERINALQEEMAGVFDQEARLNAQEAPEEHMGYIERAQREHIAKEKARIQAAIDEQNRLMEAALTDMEATAEQTASSIGTAFQGQFEMSEGAMRNFADLLERMEREGRFDVHGRVHLEQPEYRALDSPSVHAIPMASGGFGEVTRPTLFLAGEKGREQFAFSGAGKSFKDGNGDVHVVILPHGGTVQDVLAALPKEARRNEGQFGAKLYSALAPYGVR